MKSPSSKLAAARQALAGTEISTPKAAQMRGGWAPYKPLIRNAYPYILDTDRP